VAPAAAALRMQSSQSTDETTCFTRAALIAAGSLTAWPVVLVKDLEPRRREGHRGEERGKRGARRLHQPAVVGARDVERNHLLAPAGPGGLHRGSDFGFFPETMIWPGALKFAASMSNSRRVPRPWRVPRR